MFAPDTALLVIDMQPDFMSPGPLACSQAQDIVPDIHRLLQAKLYSTVVATQDWHPPGHHSFASTHPGRAPFTQQSMYGHPQTLWPDHCVQGQPGAALHPAIDWTPVDLILRKGTHPQVDSYSAFRENFGPNGRRASTGLAAWLQDRGIRSVHLCGLARDVCVLWSAQDAVTAGFATHCLWALTRPVTVDSDANTQALLDTQQVTIDHRSIDDLLTEASLHVRHGTSCRSR